jgi:hypothetical protein
VATALENLAVNNATTDRRVVEVLSGEWKRGLEAIARAIEEAGPTHAR